MAAASETSFAAVQLVFQGLLGPTAEEEPFHVFGAAVGSCSRREGLVDSLVAVEMGTHGKTPAALSTGIRAFPSVHPLVALQIRTLDEPLATVGTRERALPCVNALVLRQVGAAAKPLATGTAGVGALARMGFTVFSESRTLSETFPTVGTVVGSGDQRGGRRLFLRVILVGAPVPVEVGTDGEAFPTVLADVWPFPCVNPLMTLQIRFLGESLATGCAGKGTLPCVDTLVLHQVGAAVESLATSHTQVGLLPRVDLLMFSQDGVLPEATSTLGALVWRLRCGLTVASSTTTHAFLPTLPTNPRLFQVPLAVGILPFLRMHCGFFRRLLVL